MTNAVALVVLEALRKAATIASLTAALRLESRSTVRPFTSRNRMSFNPKSEGPHPLVLTSTAELRAGGRSQ